MIVVEKKAWIKYLERQKKKEDKKNKKGSLKKNKSKDELLKDCEELRKNKRNTVKDEEALNSDKGLNKSEYELVKDDEGLNEYQMLGSDGDDEEEIVEDKRLELLGIKDTKRRGIRGNGKYFEYLVALNANGLLDSIKELLREREFIIVRNSDFAKKLGMRFTIKQPMSIYWGLKYTLFHAGIVCEERIHADDNGKLLFMRPKKDGDNLPPSLQFEKTGTKKYRK
jgi:hypothetical protein